MLPPQFVYRAIVIDVYDGDTITLDIDLGFGVWIKGQKIRLYGIDAPELRLEEREEGLKTRDWLRDLILNKEVVIETLKDKKEKYGRWLGKIYYNSELVNERLVAEKLAARYLE